jgi:hypothetical protein
MRSESLNDFSRFISGGTRDLTQIVLTLEVF